MNYLLLILLTTLFNISMHASEHRHQPSYSNNPQEEYLWLLKQETKRLETAYWQKLRRHLESCPKDNNDFTLGQRWFNKKLVDDCLKSSAELHYHAGYIAFRENLERKAQEEQS